jgi:hypothetical protein
MDIHFKGKKNISVTEFTGEKLKHYMFKNRTRNNDFYIEILDDNKIGVVINITEIVFID